MYLFAQLNEIFKENKCLTAKFTTNNKLFLFKERDKKEIAGQNRYKALFLFIEWIMLYVHVTGSYRSAI